MDIHIEVDVINEHGLPYDFQTNYSERVKMLTENSVEFLRRQAQDTNRAKMPGLYGRRKGQLTKAQLVEALATGVDPVPQQDYQKISPTDGSDSGNNEAQTENDTSSPSSGRDSSDGGSDDEKDPGTGDGDEGDEEAGQSGEGGDSGDGEGEEENQQMEGADGDMPTPLTDLEGFVRWVSKDEHVSIRHPNPGMSKNAIETLIKQRIAKASYAPQGAKVTVVTGKKTDSSTVAAGQVVHYAFERILRYLINGVPVFSPGPAGCGKTTLFEQVFKAIKTKDHPNGLPFHALSNSEDTSKHEFLGHKDLQGNVTEPGFKLAFRDGGGFLNDEADNGRGNMNTVFNAAIDNGYMQFPDAFIHSHADFRFACSANTIGQGADRQYIGRHAQDMAFLDRFAFVPLDYDPDLERFLSNGNTEWMEVVWKIRENVRKNRETKVIAGTRAIKLGAIGLEAGESVEEVLSATLFRGVSPEIVTRCMANVDTSKVT